MSRSCADCNRCCHGVLPFTMKGIPVYAGNPCPLVTKDGCSDYENRDDVCRKFKCAWLMDDWLPMWMKPSEVGCIISYQQTASGEMYLDIAEDGKLLDVRVLTWFFKKYASGEVENLRWQQNGGWNWVGTQAFVDAMDQTVRSDVL